ncbi:class I adenylate-forming enzyme family protein [Frankia tisae]|uniref:class I adenylate-forming enzyme family protein n=1 Tax=Frankia tisae TaxID=2950104 RepID=UPI003556CD55
MAAVTTSASAVIPVDDLTFWEVCERRARLTPDRLMIVDERDRRITFGEFRDRAQRVAAGLHQLGIGPGSRVSWQLPTRIETLLVCLALARLGAHQNPVIPAVRGREVGFALRQTGAEWVVLPGTWNGFDYVEMVSGLDWSDTPQPRIVVVGVDDLPDGDPATLPPPPTDPRQARWTFYTSGTTSEPKGVLHSDESLMWGGRGYAERMRLDADTVFAMQFAIAHIGGPNLFCFMFSVGIRTLSVERFDPSSLVELFRRHRVNLCGGSVAFGELLLREQRRRGAGRLLPDLRELGGGAGPTPPAMFDQITAELGVTYIPAYGMTEVPMIAVGFPDDDVELRRGTDGAPVRGIEIRAARLDGTVAGPGEEGELQIRGPQVCKGYRDPAQTAEAFVDGWLRTGDLGVVRPDGRIKLTGRIKDIIIRKGENISAREIEDLLGTHPLVARVAVVGLPDDERGERVCAVVERAPGQPDLDFAEMQRHLLAAGLGRYKLPEQLELTDELPTQGSMLKISKAAVRRELLARAGAGT